MSMFFHVGITTMCGIFIYHMEMFNFPSRCCMAYDDFFVKVTVLIILHVYFAIEINILSYCSIPKHMLAMIKYCNLCIWYKLNSMCCKFEVDEPYGFFFNNQLYLSCL